MYAYVGSTPFAVACKLVPYVASVQSYSMLAVEYERRYRAQAYGKVAFGEPVECNLEVGKLVVDNPESAFLHSCFLGVVLVVAAFGVPVVNGSKHLVDVGVNPLFVIVANKRLFGGI